MNASDVTDLGDSSGNATVRPKLLVLGATGGTGRLIVRQALARGYDMRAMVRSPDKASGLEGAEIQVGDARDAQALRKALEGRNAVVSALGTPASPFREVTLLSTATRALVVRCALKESTGWSASPAWAPGTASGTAGFCSIG